MMGELIYMDEYRRARWLLKLQVARETGELAVFNALTGTDAVVIPFPRQSPEDTGGDAA